MFPDQSIRVVSIKTGRDISLIEAGWTTPQTWPVVCRHGSGSPTAANRPDGNGVRWTPITEIQALTACRRKCLWLVGKGPVDGCLGGRSVGGRSVGGWLDSKQAGWFDHSASKPLAIHNSNRLISKHTNQPSDRLAMNPTTDHRSIHPTDR